MTIGSLTYGQTLPENSDSTMVIVPLEDIRASYDKMVERKVLLQYVESLEKELAATKLRIDEINISFSDYKEEQKEFLKLKDDKYSDLEKLVKVQKFQFLLGVGGTTNRAFDLIQLNLHGGFMIKQKRMFTLNVGMDNRQNFLFGGNFFTVF